MITKRLSHDIIYGNMHSVIHLRNFLMSLGYSLTILIRQKLKSMSNFTDSKYDNVGELGIIFSELFKYLRGLHN